MLPKFMRFTSMASVLLVCSFAEAKTRDQDLHCLDTEDSKSYCQSFIQGFLQGALLTDSAIVESISDQNTKSGFSERAIRTRIGNRNAPPTALAGFCLPSNSTIADIVDETLDHVGSSTVASEILAQNVYSSLKRDYPCEKN